MIRYKYLKPIVLFLFFFCVNTLSIFAETVDNSEIELLIKRVESLELHQKGVPNKDKEMTSTEIIFRIIEISVQFGVGLVGLIAFTSWRKQLKYKEELNIAKNMLKSLYKYEGKLEQLRNPFISPSETITAYRSLEQELPASIINAKNHSKIVYDYRINNCLNSLIELSDYASEGKVYWEKEIEILWEELKTTFIRLRMKIDHYIRIIDKYDEEIVDLKDYFLYGIPMDKEHEIIISLNNSKKELEEFLRKRIEIEKDWVDILFFRFNPLYK